jgi:tRNA (guanine37-N1)-methyltransferase
MLFDVFTLFPQVIEPYLNSSILSRARENQLITVHLHNIRDWTHDRHHVTDDAPYGGGGGMVMKAPPIFEAVEQVLGAPPECPVILMSPQGRTFTSVVARELAQLPHIALLCGRYEGIDERVRDHLVTDQISVGDYVLTGGELPAMIIIDAVTRFIPGALGDPTGAMDDSFASGLLEYPHYTRPEVYAGQAVPDVLRSGDHARIRRWRLRQALIRTALNRPDLLEGVELSDEEIRFLDELKNKPDQEP